MPDWRHNEDSGGECKNVDRRTATATYITKQTKKNKAETEAKVMEFSGRKAKGALSFSTNESVACTIQNRAQERNRHVWDGLLVADTDIWA